MDPRPSNNSIRGGSVTIDFTDWAVPGAPGCFLLQVKIYNTSKHWLTNSFPDEKWHTPKNVIQYNRLLQKLKLLDPKDAVFGLRIEVRFQTWTVEDALDHFRKMDCKSPWTFFQKMGIRPTDKIYSIAVTSKEYWWNRFCHLLSQMERICKRNAVMLNIADVVRINDMINLAGYYNHCRLSDPRNANIWSAEPPQAEEEQPVARHGLYPFLCLESPAGSGRGVQRVVINDLNPSLIVLTGKDDNDDPFWFGIDPEDPREYGAEERAKFRERDCLSPQQAAEVELVSTRIRKKLKLQLMPKKSPTIQSRRGRNAFTEEQDQYILAGGDHWEKGTFYRWQKVQDWIFRRLGVSDIHAESLRSRYENLAKRRDSKVRLHFAIKTYEELERNFENTQSSSEESD